jgi:hypothetical protein
MRLSKVSTVLLLTFLLAAALAGCGPRAGGGELIAAAGAEDTVIDLPALYVDFAADGAASVGGTPVSQLSSLVGVDLSMLNQSPSAIAALTGLNIQHIQINNTDHGLDILVNGRKVPSLGWDEESLSGVGALVGGLLPVDMAQALPLLSQTGTGVVLRFPVAAGQEALPLVDPDAEASAAAARAAVESIAAIPAIQATVQYNEDGTWTVEGRGPDEYEAIVPLADFGVPRGWAVFNLRPMHIQGLRGAGVSQLNIASDAEGITIGINGSMLPTITWGEGELENVLQLAADSGLLASLTGGSMDPQMVMDLVTPILPMVRAANVNLTINFPS